MKLPFPFFRVLLLVLSAVLCLWTVRSTSAADDGLPDNLSRGLHPLVLAHTGPAAGTRSLRSMSQPERRAAVAATLGRNRRRIQTDPDSRVIVRVRLDGTVPAETVEASLAALGASVTAGHAARRPDGRDGTLTVHVPIDQAAAAARMPGVFSVLTAHRPRPRVGKVTSQGAAALHTDAVNTLGYTGKGITVGVLSDSYDVATARSAGGTISTFAADDVASGDLPGKGNPDGDTTPVIVLADGSTNPSAENTDEGRAMLQIIHDLAPGATLVFQTAGDTTDEFAANIRALRTNGNAHCDVIVDDIGYDDEPFFSDGVASEAVDEVVTSISLAGRPVAYYSAAGNDGDLSYTASFTGISDAAGRASGIGNLRLSSVPDELTAGGFHNFKAADTGSGTKIVQKVTVSEADAYINFQWDDPFLPRGQTSGYCLLVFDADGNYLPGDSGIDNTFNTGEALQTAYLPLNGDGSDTKYQLVISRRAGGTGAATHLRYIVEDSGVVIGKYLRTGQPTLYGHSGAANADGVAAYDVHDTTVPESYESFGPVTLYFDAAGNRYPTPVTRQQPTVAAVDGVDTTFFEPGDLSDTDSDGDGFPNFYGTSAAAPHAAAVAALLLEAGGGKGSLSAAQIRSLLEATAADHDLDPAHSAVTLTSPDGAYQATVSADGDASNNSAFDQKFFTVSYTGPAGSSVVKTALDISPVGEVFDLTTDNGFPFTIGAVGGGLTKTDVTETVGAGSAGIDGSKLTLSFAPGAFVSNGSISFGVDRDNASLNPPSGGNSADLLAGGKVKIKILEADGTKLKLNGVLSNVTGHGYSPDVGYGLINAQAALQKLLGK